MGFKSFLFIIVSAYTLHVRCFFNHLALLEYNLQSLTQFVGGLEIEHTSQRLGHQLLGKTMVNILSAGQRIVAHVDVGQQVIIAYDSARKVFQLYVLEQKFQTCALHALRNFLYCMQAVELKPEEFPAWYTSMLSQQSYDFFQQKWCPLTQRKNIIPTLYNTILQNLKTSTQQQLIDLRLPIKTPQYLNKFLILTFDSTQIANTKQLQSINIALNEVEAGVLQLHSDKIVTLGSNSLDQCAHFLELVRRYQSAGTFIFGCELGVFTLMQHATTLVINKVNNQSEYIFMDSYFNSSFINGSFAKNYQQAIFTIIDYVEQPKLLENDCIRYIYGNLIYTISNYERWAEKNSNNLLKIPEQFEVAYDWLRKLMLLDADLYKATYKQAFLNKATVYTTKYFHQKALYDQVIEKFTL